MTSHTHMWLDHHHLHNQAFGLGMSCFVKATHKKIKVDRLSALCSKTPVWEYFDIDR